MAATTKNYSIRQFLDVYLECLLLSQSISKGTEIRTLERILRSCKKVWIKVEEVMSQSYQHLRSGGKVLLLRFEQSIITMMRGRPRGIFCYCTKIHPPIIMDVDFTAPSHLLRLQFVPQDVFSHEHIPPKENYTSTVSWTHFYPSSINDFYDVSLQMKIWLSSLNPWFTHVLNSNLKTVL